MSKGTAMKIEIRNKWSGEIVFAGEHDSTKLALETAAKSGANLSGADLGGAYLHNANLSGANLYGAYLSGAYLCDADLSGANLSGAYLHNANLSGANLSGADLSGADLSGANLYGAYLSGARNSELALARVSITPDGAFVGWKKCRYGRLVKLMIPTEARRSNATGRKCRAEFVDVLEVIGGAVAISEHDFRTKYRAGERVACHQWEENRWVECGGGIHFYLTRAEAENH